MSRFPEPSPPDCCGGCDRDRPLFLLEGADGDHVHRCRDGLRDALIDGDHVSAAGQQDEPLKERDEARAWARALWPATQPPYTARVDAPGPVPHWLTSAVEQR
ncbi:hypothetical protein [Blastococcus sp. PRF04-17]|uniref:hypothetical protein n=1 Tax=Blastococcus sp. PRF04-17 TaxID=2933797 RepID=UPI001FF29F3A|nr:hypothetical protein [Blastococcus sp. PRF04-17]UOY01653.1 hypothetical protein MVA48_22490 [Blastococcus sp. PRF04-17]